jgi:hypothetical protein
VERSASRMPFTGRSPKDMHCDRNRFPEDGSAKHPSPIGSESVRIREPNGIDRQGAETGTRSVCPRRHPGRERVRRWLGQAFGISGSGTEVVVLMPSRLREVAEFRKGAPSMRAIRRAQTFF